jgi:hypothetical protein
MKSKMTLLVAFVLLVSSFMFSSCKDCGKKPGRDGNTDNTNSTPSDTTTSSAGTDSNSTSSTNSDDAEISAIEIPNDQHEFHDELTGASLVEFTQGSSDTVAELTKGAEAMKRQVATVDLDECARSATTMRSKTYELMAMTFPRSSLADVQKVWDSAYPIRGSWWETQDLEDAWKIMIDIRETARKAREAMEASENKESDDVKDAMEKIDKVLANAESPWMKVSEEMKGMWEDVGTMYRDMARELEREERDSYDGSSESDVAYNRSMEIMKIQCNASISFARKAFWAREAEMPNSTKLKKLKKLDIIGESVIASEGMFLRAKKRNTHPRHTNPRRKSNEIKPWMDWAEYFYRDIVQRVS